MYRVLYVDDEPILLDLGKRFLEREGQYFVDTITTAPDALSLLNTKNYDVIVADYQMPGMDGIELLKAIRSSANTIPFILFTGRGREEVVIQALNEGADFYLQKGGEPRSQFAELSNKIQYAIMRRRTEESLKQNEIQLRQIIDLVPHMIFVTDWDGNYLLINKAFAKNFNHDINEIVGKNQALFHPDAIEFEHLLNENREVIMTDTSRFIPEEDFIDAFGNHHILQITKVPFAMHDNSPKAVLGVAIDITERKMAEKALQVSEKKFQQIVETMDEGISQLDENLIIVYVNHRMAQMHGFTIDEMIGISITSFLEPEDIPRMTTIIKGNGLVAKDRCECRFTTKDGQNRWMQISVTPLRNKDGSFNGSFAMCSDITERKKAETELNRSNEELYAAYEQLTATEEELRENYEELANNQQMLIDSEQRYRNVVEDQTEFISRFLPDGTHVFVNDEYCRYFGLNREEIIGHQFRPKIPAEDKERLTQFFASITPDHPVDVIGHRIIMPDGSIRWQQWSDRAIFDSSGKIIEFQSVGRDITEETETRTALQASEIRFREQYQNNPLAILTWQHRNGDFILIDCNKAAISLTGSQSLDYLGVRASDFYADQPEFLSDIRRCFSEEAVISKELVSDPFLPDRHIHFTMAFIPPDLIMVHIDDITERKRSEETLRENQRVLAEAMDLANLVTWECDIKTGVLTFDDRFSTLYGWNVEHKGIHHMTAEVYLRDVVYQEDYDILVQEDEKTRNTTDPDYVSKREYRIIRGDGDIRYIEMCVGVIKDAVGRTIKTHGVNQDITERKIAEEGLRKSQRMLAEAMDLANMVNWECDIRKGVLTFDGRFSKLYGWNVEHKGIHSMTAEKYMREIVHPEDRGILTMEDERTRNTTDPNYVSKREYRIIRGDGDIRYIEMCVGVTKDAGGRTIKTHGVNQDITERKKAEEALRRANYQLNLLSGVTRHDVSNKITGILGYINLAEMQSDDPVIHGYLKKIESAVTDIQSQVEFNRIYNDLGTSDPQWIELDKIIPRSHVPSTITLITDIQSVELFADPMLGKAIFNLLDNSLRHGRHVTEIRVTSEKAGDELAVVWEDNGIGVAAEEKNRIFERGFGKNTGMGMFLIREILSLTGITIKENGIPGRGARFEMIVPKRQYRSANHQIESMQ